MCSLFDWQVAAWMVGIKRLIQEARNVDPPLSPTSIATNTVPLATDSCDMPAIIPTRVDSSQSDSDAKTDAEMVEETEKANSCTPTGKMDVVLPATNESGDGGELTVTERLPTSSLS